MEKKIFLLITGFSLSLLVGAQTLFVPTGTNGVGISANNNVGIGTSTPGAKLEVSGDIFGSLDNSVITVKDDNIGLVKKYADSGVWAVGSNYNHRFGKWSTPSLIGNVSTGVFTEQMRIANNGNVGIGTTSPMYSLQIQKTSANPALMIGGGYSQSPRIQTYGLDADPNAWMGLGTDMGGNIYEHSIYFPYANGTGRLSIGSYNGSSYNTKMTVLENGNVGIGTTVPENKLHVVEASQSEFYGTDNGMPISNMVLDGSDNGRVVGKGPSLTFRMPANTDGSNSWAQARILASPDNTNNGDARGRLYLQVRDLYNPGVGGSWNWRTGLMISANGNVGIGSQNPDQKLTVKGKIHAEEVIIDLAVPADYVFKPNYKLMPLHQVEQFVKKNSHLPEIPSASEITKNGLNMGEMQNKLLQKVEELTLYLIEQQKHIDIQNEEIRQLKKIVYNK